jgi:hypothetical protein
MVADAGLERAALQQVPGRVPVARRLGTGQRVLDHRPAQQNGRERLLGFQRLGRGVEHEVEIAVDLPTALEHQPGGVAQLLPFDEEAQGEGEAREAEGMLERLPLRNDVLEVGQRLEVGAQMGGIEAGLEPGPAEPLRLVLPAGGEERRHPDLVPGVGARARQGEGPFLLEVPGGRLGRRPLLEDGERLLGPPGSERRVAIAAAPWGERRPVSCAMNASTSPSWSAISCKARRSTPAVVS